MILLVGVIDLVIPLPLLCIGLVLDKITTYRKGVFFSSWNCKPLTVIFKQKLNNSQMQVKKISLKYIDMGN